MARHQSYQNSASGSLWVTLYVVKLVFLLKQDLLEMGIVVGSEFVKIMIFLNYRYEEMLLVLMLSECIARKDAVLSQDPKFVSEREKTYKNATMTYDLIGKSIF